MVYLPRGSVTVTSPLVPSWLTVRKSYVAGVLVGLKLHLIHLTIFAGGDGRHKVAVLVPVGALTVRRSNVTIRVDLIHCACKGVLGVNELAVLVVG